MKKTLLTGALGFVIAALAAAPAFAGPVEGRKILLKDNGKKEKINALLKGSGVEGISAAALEALQGSPGGAMLDVCAGSGVVGSLELPYANWSTNKKGTLLKYKDKGNTSGIKVISLKPGKSLKIVGKNTVLEMGAALQSVAVRLTVGDMKTCANYSDPKKDTGSQFKAKKGAAPSDCEDETLGCAVGDGSPSAAFLD